jgi:fatty-acyl-CoA synthase
VNLKEKDTVALIMHNRPDFVAFWLGVSKVGVRTALLNTNVTGKALVHSVQVAVADSKTKVMQCKRDI